MLTGLGIYNWTWNIPNICGEWLIYFLKQVWIIFDRAWFGEMDSLCLNDDYLIARLFRLCSSCPSKCPYSIRSCGVYVHVYICILSLALLNPPPSASP